MYPLNEMNEMYHKLNSLIFKIHNEMAEEMEKKESNLYLEVEVSAGCSINAAARQAHILAKKLEINIQFKFNGVKCVCHPVGNHRRLVNEFQRAIKQKDGLRMAFN